MVLEKKSMFVLPLNLTGSFLAALFFLLFTPYAHADLKEVALVIGNSSYQAQPTLRNPGNDASLVAEKLKSVGFEIVGGKPALNLTQREMAEVLDEFLVDAKGADITIIYYAGHGIQVGSENYLVPVDARPRTPTDAASDSIGASEILAALGLVRAKLNLVILDACRKDPFPLLAIQPGLVSIPVPPETVIWFAAAPGHEAQDGSGSNGPFALAISHYIAVPGLGMDDLLNRAGNEVLLETKKLQEPVVEASPMAGMFYFVTQDGKAAFVPYDQTIDQTGSPVDLASSLFSSGISVPNRNFSFGDSYEKVNSQLDSSFSIQSWVDLPQANEYTGDQVKYFWVYLSALPVVQSALASLGRGQQCIDPNSYIGFFFKNQQFFHSSIRLFRSPSCTSYAWLKDALFPLGQDTEVLQGNNGAVDLVYHEAASYTVLEITKRGVANEDSSIWKSAY